MFLRVLRSTKSQRFRYEYKSITRSCSSKNGDNDKPGSKSCDKTSDSFKSIIDPSSGHSSITDGSLSPLGSKGKHLYHEDCENGVNCQILAELNAAYAYLSMACFFGNIGVSLPGCANFFRDMFDEEIGHAKIFIDYQNLRGGMVKLRPISVPDVDDWGSIIKALEVGLEMEKAIKEKLINLYNTACRHNDISLEDLISTKFMEEQDKSISTMSRLLVRANKMGCCGFTEYMCDKEIFNQFVKNKGKDDNKKYV